MILINRRKMNPRILFDDSTRVLPVESILPAMVRLDELSRHIKRISPLLFKKMEQMGHAVMELSNIEPWQRYESCKALMTHMKSLKAMAYDLADMVRNKRQLRRAIMRAIQPPQPGSTLSLDAQGWLSLNVEEISYWAHHQAKFDRFLASYDRMEQLLSWLIEYFEPAWLGYLSKSKETIDITLDSPVCAICLDSIEESSGDIQHCHHVFHTSCINKWLEDHVTCPTCRRVLPHPDPIFSTCENYSISQVLYTYENI